MTAFYSQFKSTVSSRHGRGQAATTGSRQSPLGDVTPRRLHAAPPLIDRKSWYAEGHKCFSYYTYGGEFQWFYRSLTYQRKLIAMICTWKFCEDIGLVGQDLVVGRCGGRLQT